MCRVNGRGEGGGYCAGRELWWGLSPHLGEGGVGLDQARGQAEGFRVYVQGGIGKAWWWGPWGRGSSGRGTALGIAGLREQVWAWGGSL